MKLAVLKERTNAETRVAASPESVRKLTALGHEVWVEGGAGVSAHIGDGAFESAGARIAAPASQVLADADVVLKVRAPSAEELERFPAGATLIGMLDPYRDRSKVRAYADAGVDAFALELLPRITRAQGMDVLTSQSNLAGYKAVIDAAAELPRALPMMMTAAGTIAPARVLVLGAGVAGLQAIATARRLGAIVAASDVRPAAREQVESLGATFLTVPDAHPEEAETAGGYARAMGEDYRHRQAALIAETLPSQDIVILTALVPGRPAPLLVSEEMVARMRPGSVIVDLAVEQGGNCAASCPGERAVVHQVTVLGYLNVPGRMASDASTLYARNLLNFLTPMLKDANGRLSVDWNDEIVTATALTRAGEVIHPAFSEGADAGADVTDVSPSSRSGD